MRLFKRHKKYFTYNPETLNYEQRKLSFKDRLIVVLQHMVSGVGMGVFFFFVFSYLLPSPVETELKKENKLLQTQYEVLSLRLSSAMDALEDIQQRDENLYRAIFQTESIPESVRKSGFGGTDRYDHLQNLNNAELVVSTTRKMDILSKQLYVQSNSLEELIGIGKRQKERSFCVPAIQPIANKDLKRTASGYGMRIDPVYHVRRFHAGMDFSAETGTDIYATGNGKVTFSARRQGYGLCIIIDHGFGYKTLYAHLSKLHKRVGQKVARGEVIGLVGNTGKSTGSHLHYEVILHGRHQNPANYYFMDLTPEEYDKMIQLAENHGQVMD